jgi:hypothetical protein
MSRFRVTLLVLLTAGVAATGAQADGLPVLGVDVGSSGVTSPDVRYVTLPATTREGRAFTVVARVRRDGGQVLGSRALRGMFTIPAVAYDRSASGLSADGRTLVLIQPRSSFPRAWTALKVLDTKQLRARATVRLHGDFSFDAISPRGSLLYLIQYIAPRDPNRYNVRAYDLRAGRLLHEPVTDPHERGEQMRGSPVTRATSPDGRWAYTLYNSGTPFIHALDTSRRTARCIDLDALVRRDLSGFRLHADPGAGTLTVSSRGQTELVVDTTTFRVRAPSPSEAAGGHASSWAVAGVAAAGVLLLAGALLH